MEISSGVKLGHSACLLDGYNSTAYLERDGKSLLKTTPKQALPEIVPENPQAAAKWDDYPVISLHSTTEELISAIQPVQLRANFSEDHPSRGGGVPQWGAGSLTLAGLNETERKAALTEFSEEIGIKLYNPDISYALVRWSRTNGTAVHPCYKLGLFTFADSVQVNPEAQQV